MFFAFTDIKKAKANQTVSFAHWRAPGSLPIPIAPAGTPRVSRRGRSLHVYIIKQFCRIGKVFFYRLRNGVAGLKFTSWESFQSWMIRRVSTDPAPALYAPISSGASSGALISRIPAITSSCRDTLM